MIMELSSTPNTQLDTGSAINSTTESYTDILGESNGVTPEEKKLSSKERWEGIQTQDR